MYIHFSVQSTCVGGFGKAHLNYVILANYGEPGRRREMIGQGKLEIAKQGRGSTVTSLKKKSDAKGSYIFLILTYRE
jgi:hypothetical protein